MKKALSIFFILLGTALILVSDSTGLTREILNRRNQGSGWLRLRHWRNAGDLVSLSYLYDEKQFVEKKDYQFKRAPGFGNGDIDLYVYGDSYLLDIPDSAFGPIHRYRFERRDYTDLDYRLDPPKKNILIIGTGERFVRDWFSNLSIFDHVKKAPAETFPVPGSPTPVVHASFSDLQFDLFNHGINQHLESHLFDYPVFTPLRMLKARSVYSWFDRASGNVALSEDGKYLFLKETVAAHGHQSCYEPIDSGEFSKIIYNIDSIYRHYRKEGFDDVWFSIIPNPATILQPQYYDHLIPELQQMAARKGIHFIDVYDPFRASPDPGKFYCMGDSHWNNRGLQVWLEMVNERLRKIHRSE